MALLISDHVLQSLDFFESVSLVLHKLSDAARQKFLDEFARFKLWAGNIGAHRKGRSSLDWRLRDASHLKDLVVSLLADLKSPLHDILSMLDGSANMAIDSIVPQGDIPTSERISEPGDFEHVDGNTEALEIVADIGDIIGCLLRLSVSIRNPAPHDHFMSKLIDTSHFEEYDMLHVKAKLPHAPADLVHRLGKAISQRRQYFRYRETHQQKLNSGLYPNPDKPETAAESTVASSIPTVFKNGESSRSVSSQMDDENASNSGASQTSYATSDLESGRLKMPPLPSGASHGPFECPFCYMMISVSTTVEWIKHVNADLRPYICLEPHCLTTEQQYTKRREWLHHMNRKHWRVFRCSYSCQGPDFASSSSLECHIRQSHPESSSQRDLGVIIDLCERPKPWPEKAECPLCQEALHSKPEYVRHVGQHQIELALFALPHIGDDDDDMEDEKYEEQHSQPVNMGSDLSEDSSDSEKSELSFDNDHIPEHTLGLPAPTQSSWYSSTNLKGVNPQDDHENIFICRECGREFDQIHKLNHHTRYHQRNHECTFEGCDRRFATKTHLDRHINDRHLKLKAYHCTEPTCAWFKGGKSFPRKDNWRRHMIKKHGATLAQFEPAEEDSPKS